jgi:hypothetical protein
VGIVTHVFLRVLMKVCRSDSLIRNCPPSLWAIKSPALIQRRMVLVEALRSFPACLIVNRDGSEWLGMAMGSSVMSMVLSVRGGRGVIVRRGAGGCIWFRCANAVLCGLARQQVDKFNQCPIGRCYFGCIVMMSLHNLRNTKIAGASS